MPGFHWLIKLIYSWLTLNLSEVNGCAFVRCDSVICFSDPVRWGLVPAKLLMCCRKEAKWRAGFKRWVMAAHSVCCWMWVHYLALNNQSREQGRALGALALLGRLPGSGLAAVVLLVRPEAPLALLQRLPLLRGVVGRALAPLLGVRGSVLGVGERGSNPGAGVPCFPSQPRDVSLQQAALDDAVRLLEKGNVEVRGQVYWGTRGGWLHNTSVKFSFTIQCLASFFFFEWVASSQKHPNVKQCDVTAVAVWVNSTCHSVCSVCSPALHRMVKR